MKVALVVGHTEESQGAKNINYNISEFVYNRKIVESLVRFFSDSNIEVVPVYRNSYKKLPDEINDLNPDFIISFHCNAFNKSATGSEVLYYHSSHVGSIIADTFLGNTVATLYLKDRKTKAKHSEDRGGYILKNTNAPMVILEPFFIDNDADLSVALSKENELLKSYIYSIEYVAEKLPEWSKV